MHATATGRVGRRGILATGAVISAVFIAVLLVLMSRSTYDTWGALLLAPLLIGLTLPALARQAEREHDPRLFWFLIAALSVKLASAIVRYSVTLDLYDGLKDAGTYHWDGTALAEGFRSGNFETGLDSFTGTDFMRLITGILYTFTGPTQLGGFVVFSWLGFWGLFFFYRAFTISVPEGRARTYARLVFFFPSLLFWPSSIGKEAWMIFALGIAAYGAARVLAGNTWRGLPMATVGLWLAALVRPHVAGMLGLGLGVGFLLRRPRPELGHLAPIAKVVGLVGVGVVAFFMVLRAQTFLKSEGFEDASPAAVVRTLETVAQRSDSGGSEFDPIVVRSPSQLQVAFGTVLYRPLIFEAHNTQALIASLEATLLLLLTIVRIRWIWHALRSMRRIPFIGLIASYTLMFVIAFASFPNFGLLARQRVQLLPLFFVLLALPPPRPTKTRAQVRTRAARALPVG